MALVPGLTLADINAMSEEARAVWLHCALSVRAQQRLEFIADVSLAFAPTDQGRELHREAMAGLVRQAYGDDPEAYATALEAIYRKG